MKRNTGSFRDPSGFVYEHEGQIYRTVQASYIEEWEPVCASGLMEKLCNQGMVPAWEDLPKTRWPSLPEGVPSTVQNMLRVEKIPFISYPYEWSFSQLKDAALLTLKVQKLALEHGCILKDASAFNVQFLRGKPIFIDLLSFERLRKNQPWDAYGQFCSHFLAPLALMAKRDLACGLLSRQWNGGIPLELASKLLPLRTWFSPSLLSHLHLHAAMRRRYAGSKAAIRRKDSVQLTLKQLTDIVDDLLSVVQTLCLPKQLVTEWSNYYAETNYSDKDMQTKAGVIEKVARQCQGQLAVDLGANTGRFSRLLTKNYATVLATDMDPLAVEQHYLSCPSEEILPLVLDSTSPTPALGWQCEERLSFGQRCKADMVLGLALCHHLVITGGIPLSLVTEGIHSLLKPQGLAVLEFVSKQDSQVQRLLATREDIFEDYTLEGFIAAWQRAGFTEEERFCLEGSPRSIHVLRS